MFKPYDSETIIDTAFEYFRERGFPYRKLPVHVCMQEINKLAALPDEKLETSVLAYQVADTYHPERFDTPVAGMKTPLQAFQDDKVLKRSLTRMLEHGTGINESLIGGVGGIAITSGTQAAANFRPAYALKMYRKYCQQGDRILDTSAGFGGRLIGAAAFGNCTYIGIDPNWQSVQGNSRMTRELELPIKTRFLQYPVEDLYAQVLLNERLRLEYEDSIDFAFTSPPYFAKELYFDDGRSTQSWVRYDTIEEWKEFFLDKMMAFQFFCLKKDKYAVVNIAPVKLRRGTYPLDELCIHSGVSAGFTFEGRDTFRLQKRIGSGHENSEVASEQILIFKK